MSGVLPKPQLRGLLEKQLKIHIPGAIIVAFAIGLYVKYGIGEARKRQYTEFYKTYDDEKTFKIMVDAGLLQSVKKYP